MSEHLIFTKSQINLVDNKPQSDKIIPKLAGSWIRSTLWCDAGDRRSSYADQVVVLSLLPSPITLISHQCLFWLATQFLEALRSEFGHSQHNYCPKVNSHIVQMLCLLISILSSLEIVSLCPTGKQKHKIEECMKQNENKNCTLVVCILHIELNYSNNIDLLEIACIQRMTPEVPGSGCQHFLLFVDILWASSYPLKSIKCFETVFRSKVINNINVNNTVVWKWQYPKTHILKHDFVLHVTRKGVIF